MNISIIIPCYNEAENIADAVKTIVNGIDDSVLEYEILLVDDGSVDRSREVISALLETNSKVRAIYHPRNLGKGAALRSGFDQAQMSWVLMMDADLQIDISELKNLLPFCAAYDVLSGVRADRKEGVFRAIVSKAYNCVVSLIIVTGVQDVGCPFKLIKTSLVKKLPLTSQGFAVDAEMFCYFKLNNFKIKEMPVRCRPRQKGKSTVKLWHLFETFADLIKLKKRPM